MITTIRSKIGVTLALVLAALSFAPAALADGPQFQLRRHAPETQVKDDPFLFRNVEGMASAGLIDRAGGPDGYQPQLRGVQPTVAIASSDGIDWAAAGSGLGVGMALSALLVGALAVARHRRPAHS